MKKNRVLTFTDEEWELLKELADKERLPISRYISNLAKKEKGLETHLTVSQVSHILGIGVSTVYSWINKGKLKPLEGKPIRFKVNDILSIRGENNGSN